MRGSLQVGPMMMYAMKSRFKIGALVQHKQLTPTLAEKILFEIVQVLNENFKSDSYSQDYENLMDCFITCVIAITSYVEKIS
jgi:hypothetical protein